MKIYPFIAWLILTGLMCFLAQKYCWHGKEKVDKKQNLETANSSSLKTEEPIFQFDSPLVKVDSNWSIVADSITKELTVSQTLEIRGFSYINENDSLLGLQRARNIRTYFPGLEDSKIRYRNEVLEDSIYEESLYEMVEFKIIDQPVEANQTSVIKKDNRTLIYFKTCLLYTSPSPRDATLSRMPSSA